MILNYKNRDWMAYFHANRDLHTPVAAEWKRLSTEYLTHEIPLLQNSLSYKHSPNEQVFNYRLFKKNK